MRQLRTLTFGLATSMVVFTVSCADAPQSPTTPSTVETLASGAGSGPTASTPASTQSAQNFEVKFMTGMIDHHQMAIEMAEICLQKATHEELKAMCRNIIAAQSAEIEEMQSWLQDWYGISYEPMMKRGDEQMLERLSSMSGAEFEIMFMEMMIMHHERAIKEAQQCLAKAWHPDLRQLCEDIIAAQSAEIAQLRTWLCQWYGRCK